MRTEHLIALIAVALSAGCTSNDDRLAKSRYGDQPPTQRPSPPAEADAPDDEEDDALEAPEGDEYADDAPARGEPTDPLDGPPEGDEARRGEILLRGGDAAGAIKALHRAIERAPQVGRSHTLLGQAHLTLDQRPEALAAFRRAVALTPLDTEARYGLAVALTRLGQRQEARMLAGALARDLPDDAKIKALIAELGGAAPAIPGLSPRPNSAPSADSPLTLDAQGRLDGLQRIPDAEARVAEAVEAVKAGPRSPRQIYATVEPIVIEASDDPALRALLWLRLGYTLAQQKIRPDVADLALVEATRLAPSFKAAWSTLAIHREQQSDAAGAVYALRGLRRQTQDRAARKAILDRMEQLEREGLKAPPSAEAP